MHLSDLKNFVAVVEENSFTKAAQRLFISQPSLTVSINRLEDELGKSLIIRKRGAKEMSLSMDGEVVFNHAQKILREIDIIYDEVKYKEKTQVRLGLPPIIGAYLFPQIVKELTASSIEALQLIETGSENMKRLLKENKIDMCFIGTESPIVSPNLEKHFILRDNFSILVNPEHPLANRESVDFRELRNERFISLGEDFVQYKILKGLCLREGMFDEVRNFVITNEIQTAKLLVSNGVGVGFMINSALGSRNDLKVLRLNDPVYFYVYLVFRKDRELSSFEKIIKEDLISANEAANL
ncbi:MAG: LysR family transcriptional regulator [Streptococcaceae bacterium]|jgi:LysR family hydrogen peroxide-inducible transcriptional activator|nr:LysR family transcriptional regulator [Streptococcaceae bacterium]